MAGLIPPDKLEQIRAANDIVDVIGAALPLKRAGANFVALCPFHKEKSPSFNVNPHRQTFHCFGCHKGGDVFAFIREYENLPFMDAVKRLADRASIPLEFENVPGAGQARAVKESLLQIHEQLCQRWQAALANDAAGQVARDYLAQRGVSEEAVKLFRLGYAPEVWDDTVNWAKNKGHDLALVEQGGLIVRKEGTDRHYDRFRGRLMFPICDEQGRVIAFSGRLLQADAKAAKYVNSPETPIFTKGRVFFGLDKSKRAILEEEEAILCEGQLDLIACHSAGIKNVIAPQGTALTRDHARILKRFTNLVAVCFDGDRAGWDATIKSLDSFLEAGLSMLIVSVPAPHDPDSYIKAFGADAFRKLVKEADAYFDFYLRFLCTTNDPNTDRGRVAITQYMAEALHKTGSAVLLDTYAQKTALRLAVDPAAVRAEFQKQGRARPFAPPPEAEESTAAPIALTPPSEREFWFLRFVLSHDDDEQMDWLARNLSLDWVEHALVKQVIVTRLKAHAEHSWRGVPGLCDALEDEATRQLVTAAVTADVHKAREDAQQRRESISRNIIEAVRLLRNDHFDRQLLDCKRRLTQADLAADELARVLQQQTELRRAKLQPLE